jgi:flagellum-specific ATP synthase
VSRALHTLAPSSELERIRRFKQLYSRYHRSRDLISVGAYSQGSDPVLDTAISLYPRMEAYLQQDMGQKVGFEDSRRGLESLFITGAENPS